MPTTSDVAKVAVQIADREWRHWDDFEFHRGLDSHPTVGFSAPFDVERREIRDTFRPFSFQPLAVEVDGERMFTGTLVDVVPRLEDSTRTIQCSGYSLPAVLEDSNLPADRVPFEASGLTLQQIAEQLAGYWGIGVVMLTDGGAAFQKVKTRQKRTDTRFEHDQKVDSFLVELAKQRGVLRTSNAAGQLVFWQSIAPGNPVAHLAEGMAGVGSIVPTFNPQDYYSEITGFTTAKRGSAGTKYTQRNARLAGGALRSLSFKLEDVEKGDAPKAVAAKMGRMFASVMTIVVNLPSWRGPSGKLWEPNTTITLHAPGAMIYSPFEFLIRDVYFKQSANEQSASIGLVFPEAFAAEIPKSLPWEEPLT